ncbi:MAG: ABC transporter substrate-binding protein [Actinomycetota bacterium]|nr:ABC transporter substrate-binding protein [Actinomycetota bacterium]
MKVRTGRRLLARTALAATLLLAACGGSDSNSSTSTPGSVGDSSSTGPASTAVPVAGGTLITAEAQDTAEMDPAISTFDMSWRLQAFVYETLVTTNAQSELLPGIAESWEQPSDTSFVFTLRPGVTFSNGRALTADDVVGSLQRIIDPNTGSYWAPQMGPIDKITAVDATTVQVDLTAPYAPFLASLANISAAILPMTELTDGSFDPTTQMLGSGPFMLKEHLADQQWTFERNPNYWREGFPLLDGVEVRVVPDDATRVAALRDGSIDIGYFGSPDAPALLDGVADVDVTVQRSSDMYWLQLNSVGPDSPFADVRVRQAVAYALDRDAIITNALAGNGEATGVASAGLPGACAADGLPTYTRDVEKAKALLAEAGVTDLKFEIIVPPYLSTFSPIAQVIQQNLGDAGIEVTISSPEFGTYLQSVYIDQPATFEGVVDYFAGYLDPAMVMQFLAPARNPVTAGFLTESPELTAAIDAAAVPGSADERAAAVAAACVAAADFANVIPIATKNSTVAVRTDRVNGTVADFDAYDIYLRGIETFSIVKD